MVTRQTIEYLNLTNDYRTGQRYGEGNRFGGGGVCLGEHPCGMFYHTHAHLWVLQECDNLWWDAFTTEFFEDDAMLTITFCLEDGPKRYSECPL